MKGIIVGIFLVLPLTLFCQQLSDSLEVYGIVKWKLNRYQDVFHYDYPACEKANISLDTTLQALKKSFNSQGHLLEFRTSQRDTLKYLNTLQEKRFSKSEEIHKEEKKQQRSKGRKEGLTVGGIIVILVLLL